MHYFLIDVVVLQMQVHFYKEFSDYLARKKTSQIPTTQIYEMMVNRIKYFDKSGPKKEKLNHHEANLLKRYSLSIENTESVLYHQDERHKGEKQQEKKRVIQQEELFTVLHNCHKKLGHAGINLMWQDLRCFYGISK